MGDVVIRRAVEGDAEQLARLHVQVWNEAYSGLMAAEVLAERSASSLVSRIERWRHRVEDNTVYVAERDGRVIGWAERGPGRDDDLDTPELMSLYVTAEVYGTGLGHRLLTAAIGAEPVYLWVLDGNERAIAFYERHGFAFDGAAKQDPPYGTERRMVRAG